MSHCGSEAIKADVAGQINLSADTRKAIHESRAGSIMAFGLNRLLGLEFRIQLVDPVERTPDVRIMSLNPMEKLPRFDEVNYLDVEVVTLDEHSEESPDDFLLRTKLSIDKGGYPEGTTILCLIDKTIAGSKPWKDISDRLRSEVVQARYDTFLLARVDPVLHKYLLARVHPELDSTVEFDVLKEARQPYKKTGGTLILRKPGQVMPMVNKPGINPFLDETYA